MWSTMHPSTSWKVPPGSCLAHNKEVADIAEAYGHIQLKQNNGQPGVCGEEPLHGGILLCQELLEGDLGHTKDSSHCS